MLAACSGTKHLREGEKLYAGAIIKIETAEELNKRNVKQIIEEAVRPKPNSRFLGMRPKLWLYMAVRENPKRKFGKWLKRKGEPPVYISNVKPSVTVGIIDAKLFNNGIFNSFTVFETIEKARTAKIVYTSFVHKPYVTGEISYDIFNDSISQIISAAKGESLIKPGNDYNLGILINERLRLDALLKDHGYFYFNAEYLLFKADTLGETRSVAIKVSLKDNIPQNALAVYRINNVYIDQDFSLNIENADSLTDTTHFENYVFAGKHSKMNIRPKVILKSVYLKKGEIYSRQNHAITLNRLMAMGNFKFVQVKFTDSDSATPGLLNAEILLTSMTNRTFRTEIDLVTKSNDFTGPRLNISLLNRNTFGGAELLNLNMAGSFETQLSGNNKNLYSFALNPQAELVFPRFIVPFNIKRSNSNYIPKTRLSLSYQYLKRVNYFDMNTFQFIYGLKWKQNIKNEHELNPINISYTALSNQSEMFTSLLNSNTFLKKSYEEQFIGGSYYIFTYNEQVIPQKKIQYFLQTTSETAGSAFSLVNIALGEKPSPANPSTVIGSVYSQYAKFSIDVRSFINFRNKDKLAMRIFAGAARPFGNSNTLPYTKQFFSGGPNSIRAFHINSVGPGTFNQDSITIGFLQLGGEIKFEMNAEYRFTIYSILKGAVFIDAGNVWLQKSNPANTGSPFSAAALTNELAVGAGVGLRLDVSFFILRFDLAIPLRKPWLNANQRWVNNQINFANSSWRNENLILNIAIGYPF